MDSMASTWQSHDSHLLGDGLHHSGVIQVQRGVVLGHPQFQHLPGHPGDSGERCGASGHQGVCGGCGDDDGGLCRHDGDEAHLWWT